MRRSLAAMSRPTRNRRTPWATKRLAATIRLRIRTWWTRSAQAVGLAYQDTEELGGERKLEQRDRHRWELDPASSDDYEARQREDARTQRWLSAKMDEMKQPAAAYLCGLRSGGNRRGGDRQRANCRQKEAFTAWPSSTTTEKRCLDSLIDINRLSTATERTKLVSTLVELGPKELLKELRDKRPTCAIRTPDRSLGWLIKFLKFFPEDQGLDHWPARGGAHSLEAPLLFGLVGLHITRSLKDNVLGVVPNLIHMGHAWPGPMFGANASHPRGWVPRLSK